MRKQTDPFCLHYVKISTKTDLSAVVNYHTFKHETLYCIYRNSRTIRHSISHREPPDQDTVRHHATIFHSSINTNTVNTTTCTHNRFRHILSIVDSLLLILLNTKSPDQPKPIRTRLNFYYCLNLFAM